MAARPDPGSCTTSAELDRWYWTKDELVTMARARGTSTSGSKLQLTAALRDHLDGRPPQPAPPGRRRAAPPLARPLTRSTALPAGQRCTQQLRGFCAGEVGPRFRFDEALRAFVAASDGTSTIGDLLDLWSRRRSAEPSEIQPQFELNRFLRRWHHEHPGAGRRAALDAWHLHRDLPAEQRASAGRHVLT